MFFASLRLVCLVLVALLVLTGMFACRLERKAPGEEHKGVVLPSLNKPEEGISPRGFPPAATDSMFEEEMREYLREELRKRQAKPLTPSSA